VRTSNPANIELIHIIIIDKTALFEPQPALEDSARLHGIFTSLDFATLFFFSQSKVVSLASNPQPGGPGPCIYVLKEQSGPIIPPVTGLLFVASFDSQCYGWGIRTLLHTGLIPNIPFRIILNWFE
jgi:hypothetical protein